MPRCEIGARTTITTASVPIAALRGVTNPGWVRELHLWYVTAPTTSGGLGLARSTVLGTGGLTGPTLLPTNSTDPAGTMQAVTAWATAAPSVGPLLRRWFAGAAAIGTGIIWTWEPPGLYVPGSAAANSELVLVNNQATAAGTLDLVWVVDEK